MSVIKDVRILKCFIIPLRTPLNWFVDMFYDADNKFVFMFVTVNSALIFVI